MKVCISDLRLDGNTQSRVSLKNETINEYCEQLKEGAKFPPVVIFDDGSEKWLSDGFHRVYAARNSGFMDVEADVRNGTVRDARRFAMSANAKHGERRTNADKRRAVLMALEDEEWQRLSDNEIAEMCEVSQPFVSKIRGEGGYNRYNLDAGGRPKDDVTKLQTNQPSPKKPDEAAKLCEEIAYYEKRVRELESREPEVSEGVTTDVTPLHSAGIRLKGIESAIIEPIVVERVEARVADKLAELETLKKELEAERQEHDEAYRDNMESLEQSYKTQESLLQKKVDQKMAEISKAAAANMNIKELEEQKRQLEIELHGLRLNRDVELQDAEILRRLRKIMKMAEELLLISTIVKEQVAVSPHYCGVSSFELAGYVVVLDMDLACIQETREILLDMIANMKKETGGELRVIEGRKVSSGN